MVIGSAQNNQNSQNKAAMLAIEVSALLLVGAYISQYGFGLFPCEMCWWQRYPHFAALAFGILAFVAPPRKLWASCAAIAIAASGLIGGYHAGVEWGWWEGITSCATMAGSSGDIMADIMAAPITRCDTAPFTFLGLSLAGWNCVISLGSAALIMRLLTKKDRTDAHSL